MSAEEKSDIAMGEVDSGEEAVSIEDLEADRRNEHLENMEKIRLEFDDLKEKMYAAKIEGLQKECQMIMEGSHEEFLRRVKELEEERDMRLWLAKRWKDYQLQNINRIYEAERDQVGEEFLQDKESLRDQMANEMMDKQKKLEEEKDHLSLQNLSGEETRPMTRSVHSLRNRTRPPGENNHEPSKKKITPPHIQYTLTEDEIWDDIQMIQGGTPAPEEQKKLLMDAINFVV